MIEFPSSALHEAGHAVVAYEYGWTINSISVEPSGLILGCTRISPTGGRSITRWRCLVYLLAGLEAMRIGGQSTVSYRDGEWFTHGADDTRKARVVCQPLTRWFPGLYRPIRRWAESESRRILHARWVLCSSLTTALQTRQKLHRDEIYTVLQEAAR